MKKMILILFISFFAFSIFAQSKSSLIFGEAIIKDKRMESVGTVLTVVGGGALFAGNIIYWRMFNNSANSDSPGGKMATYRTLIFGGLGLMAVGIPLWAIGKTGERHLKIVTKLVKFEGFASVNVIGIKIRF
jgi:hypothetical protein